MTDDPLLISTLATPSRADASSRATVPCLTLVCHPDPLRVGERLVLSSLLVRRPALISRTQGLFGHPDGEQRSPLADPHLSRDPIRLLQGKEPDSIRFEGMPARAQIDGQPAGTHCEVPGAALQRGVLVQLSTHVLLLLHRTAGESQLPLDGILGHSDAVDRLRRQIARLAELGAAVLIRGESGTGKELVASALHALSRRRDRPMVSVNMATLNEATAVGVLFGYARGAFTGAHARHHGVFERADGGTLFLDEIGDTPPSVQPMLLRALETRRITPLGDEQERSVDVRVIAATELELEQGTRTGPFRAALKHRLAGYEVHVPPLRERADDIARLFVHFLRLELRALGREDVIAPANPAPALRAALIARLLRYPFPGNVRELNNLACRAAFGTLETGEIDLAAGDLAAPAEGGEEPDAPPIDDAALLEALERNEFSPLRAAAALGVPPSTVHLWMRRARIRRAVDLDDAELQRAHIECNGDLQAMAQQLRVSIRALKLQLRSRGG